MHLNDEIGDVFCPDCGLGCLKTVTKPYLQLYLGKLFTIPNAVCYQCDICRYCEFDEANFDVISEMMFGAKVNNHDDKTRPIAPYAEDTTTSQQKPPHI